MPCRRLALTACLALPCLALASRLVPGTLADRAQLAHRIVYAQVLGARTVARGGDPRALETITDVVVGQDLKGSGPARLSVHQLGGTLGPYQSRIPGDAELIPSETVILLLKCSAPDFCTLVALGEGKLKVLGEQVLQRDLSRDTTVVRTLGEVLAELQASAAPVIQRKTTGLPGVTREPASSLQPAAALQSATPLQPSRPSAPSALRPAAVHRPAPPSGAPR